jgi:endonuclease-3
VPRQRSQPTPKPSPTPRRPRRPPPTASRPAESADASHGPKQPFDIDEAIRRIRAAVKDRPKAVLFELADRGYSTPFQILVACIITIRTLEEVSLPACLRLLEVARTPDQMAALTPARIDELIRACTFHEPKSRTIHALARRVADDFGGQLPCDYDTLTGFPGVGPKCANLALGIACERPGGIPVDIHVHRVTNRWGYVTGRTPEKTMAALEAVLPRRYWVEINKLLVPFGKCVCTGKAPKCSTCPVLEFCRQVGVTDHR